MPGSLTTPSRPDARDGAPGRVAFRKMHCVGTQNRKLSRLNGWPMRTPVNASPRPSRAPAHDSGPMWIATPSSQGTCTLYSLPVSRRLAQDFRFASKPGHLRVDEYTPLRDRGQASRSNKENLMAGRRMCLVMRGSQPEQSPLPMPLGRPAPQQPSPPARPMAGIRLAWRAGGDDNGLLGGAAADQFSFGRPHYRGLFLCDPQRFLLNTLAAPAWSG
jgi:hypothetical protein